MAMTGFICHDDYYDRLKRLSNEEVGNLFRQLMLFHAGRFDEMSDFIDSEGIAFDFIADDIVRMEEKHNATSETNKINGSKGGRPKKRVEPTETEENRTKPTETEQKRTKPYKDKDKDKDKEKDIDISFERFWKCYPRHTAKYNARKSFQKINPDEELLSKMIAAVERQKQSSQWQEERYIPHPATWLNQHRWEDEVNSTAPKKVIAQAFPQRDYSDVQGEMMDDLAREVEQFKASGA